MNETRFEAEQHATKEANELQVNGNFFSERSEIKMVTRAPACSWHKQSVGELFS
jgi:hypothetical protein